MSKDKTAYGRYLGIWQGRCSECRTVVVETYSRKSCEEQATIYKCEACDGEASKAKE